MHSAKIVDVAGIMVMLKDDIVGETRESDDLKIYVKGLETIISTEITY